MSNPENPLRIGYLPYSPDENSYVAHMKRILEGFAEVTPGPDLRKLRLHPISFFKERYDVVVLNWTDNRLARQDNGRISPMGFAKFVCEALAVRLTSRRVIFVRHNHYPHHARPQSGRAIARALDALSPLFHLVVSHSGHDPASGKYYIPHPLYASSPVYSPAERDDYFVVFGRILRYKNILELVKAFPPTTRLVIAGACFDDTYLAEIRSAAQGKNVEIIADYIEEAAARELVGRSAGLIICNADEDMVVSGSYFFAVSLGTPVLALRTPFLDWLRDKLRVPGLKLFSSLGELRNKLDPHDQGDSQEIVRSGQHHFGDQRIAASWKAALARIGLAPQATLSRAGFRH